MEIELTVTKEFDVQYLLAEVGVRYWEDSYVDGKIDNDGSRMPCRDGDLWKPIINLETGIITNWNKGTTASVHYKSVDNNVFKLLDTGMNVVEEFDGSAIDMMSPKDNGYGDYVIMDIDENGLIHNWKVDFNEFINAD